MKPPELWAWMLEDEDGHLEVGYAETSGGRRAPMLATTIEGQRTLRPIAERLAQLTGLEWRLFHFTNPEELARLAPHEEAGG